MTNIAKQTTNPAPIASIIVVTRFFPNPQLEEFLQSTKHINSAYEIIIITTKNEKTNISQQNKEHLLTINPNCKKITITTLNADPGLTYCRNLGAKIAKSDNLIFSDDDIILIEDITPLLNQLQNNHYQSIQPLILKYPNIETIDSAGDTITRLNGINHAVIRGAGQKQNQLNNKLIPEQLPSLRGAFFAVKKDALTKIGGFDNSLCFNFDDVDLGWRMTIAGYKNIFLPTVKVLHRGGRTTNPSETDEKAQKFHLVNHHTIQLKIAEYSAWPFILTRFQVLTFKHALKQHSKKHWTPLDALREVIVLNTMLIHRLSYVHNHRRILSRHHHAGKATFKAMINQERFPIA